MSFPYYFEFFGQRIHPHPLFETLGYMLGARLYFFLRARRRGPNLTFEQNVWILTACLAGALLGAKILAWLESPVDFWKHRFEAEAWIGGKTIVGGMLGGWLAVELAKKKMRISISTGDLFIFPLIVGMCLGRVGCFLTGLDDHTHGLPTTLPWGVDFGDGTLRHPTQLYEIVFLLLLGITLFAIRHRNIANGVTFRVFIFSYMLFRFAVEFLKPRFVYPFGLSAIQFASLCGFAYSGWLLLQMRDDQTVSDLQPARTEG